MSSKNPRAHDMLWRGVLCAGIGLAVLLSPMFMAASPLRDTVAQSSIVGWFALVLGLAFTAQYFWKRR